MTERPPVEQAESASSWNFFRSRGDKDKYILSHAKQYTITYVSLRGVHHVAPGQASAACRRIQPPQKPVACERSAEAKRYHRTGTNTLAADRVFVENVFWCISTAYWLRYQLELN